MITRYYQLTQRELNKHQNGVDMSPHCNSVLTDEYCYAKCWTGYDAIDADGNIVTTTIKQDVAGVANPGVDAGRVFAEVDEDTGLPVPVPP